MPEEVWRIGMAGKLEGDVKVGIQARATRDSRMGIPDPARPLKW
jgi:hypothetical protein